MSKVIWLVSLETMREFVIALLLNDQAGYAETKAKVKSAVLCWNRFCHSSMLVLGLIQRFLWARFVLLDALSVMVRVMMVVDSPLAGEN